VREPGYLMRMAYVTGLFLGVSFAVGESGTGSVGVRAQYNRAQEAMIQGRFDQAIELLEPLYTRDPTVLGYGLLLAEAYIQQGQPGKARSLLGEMAARPPEDLEARILLGQMLLKIDRWGDVVSVLSPVAEGHRDYEVHHLLAEAYRQQGKWSEAIREYEAAIRVRPASGADYAALGDVYLQGDRHALAATAFLEATRNGIHTPHVHYSLAKAMFALHADLGKIEVRQVKGGHVGDLIEDGFLMSAVRGQEDTFHVCGSESALYQIQKAIALGEAGPDARYLRGLVWLRIGRYAQADEDFRVVEGKLRPDQAAEYHAYRAAAHLGLEEYDAYIEHTRLAARESPDRYGQRMAAAYLEVAERCAQRGDLESYIRYLDGAAKEAPSDPIIHHRLGYAYWESNDRKKAVRHWRIVLELSPEFPDRARLLELIEESTTATSSPTTRKSPGALQ
jgi:tetratricopeptide (TPR) repeat protein